jgi:hypothetical protein
MQPTDNGEHAAECRGVPHERWSYYYQAPRLRCDVCGWSGPCRPPSSAARQEPE